MLINNDNRAYVQLRIGRIDNKMPVWVDFKFDPGADRTTISPHSLMALGYDMKTVKSFMKPSGSGSTASGEVARHFTVDLYINHIMGQILPKGLKFPFVCAWEKDVPIPEPKCEGCRLTGTISGGFRSLLGNDILSCFNIMIDYSKKTITFTRVSDLSARNRLYTDSEFSEYTIKKNHRNT